MRVPFLSSAPTVSVVRLTGTIASGARGRLSDQALTPVLERAFRRGKPSAVALVLNSPGGSPAQSSLIAARIRRLSKEKTVPVHAFVEDLAASGGYWLATAADRIWLDASSIVGSVGVISSGFGLQDFIARHGIERRVHTAGTSKSWLDPFQPEKPGDVARLKDLQEQIHQLFIAQVKSRRPALAEGVDFFDGSVWVGQKAVDLGLADGVAHLVPQMQALYGKNVRFRAYGPKRGLLSRFGVEALDGIVAAAEDRAGFARFGL
jgi:serine protease SohB